MRKKEENLNKERGKRLSTARKRKNYTQEKLAEIAGKSVNYISMLENGHRTIDRNKAHEYATLLDVSEAYLLCETDIPNTVPFASKHTTLNLEAVEPRVLLLRYLMNTGHDFTFCVSCVENPEIILQKSFTDLHNFIYKTPACKCEYNDSLHEVIIREVLIDGSSIPFDRFALCCEMIENYISFTMNSIVLWSTDYDFHRD